MRRLLWLLLLLAPCALHAQVVGPGFVNYVTSAPSGACSQGQPMQVVMGLGTVYTCQSGTWAQVGGGGGSCTASFICPNPSGDQTILGAHALILSGGSLVSGHATFADFNSEITAIAFDPASGEIPVSGQGLGGEVGGLQGIAQGDGTGFVSGGYFVGGIVNANNSSNQAIGVSGGGFGSPASGKTLASVQGGFFFANSGTGGGTITDAIALVAASGSLDGGTVTNAIGLQIQAQATGSTSNTGLDIRDQGALNKAINVAGGLVNLGPQVTTAGNLIDSGLSASLPLFTNGSKQLTSTPPSGVTLAGLGFPQQVARVRAVSQVAAITTQTLLATGAANTDYLVVATLYCDTTSAAATAAITISYTDSGSQAQSIAPTAAACTALGSGSFAIVNTPIVAKTGTNITYAVAIANTPTYDVRIDLYQLGTN